MGQPVDLEEDVNTLWRFLKMYTRFLISVSIRDLWVEWEEGWGGHVFLFILSFPLSYLFPLQKVFYYDFVYL